LNAFNVFYLNSFDVINLIVIRLQFVKLNPLRVFLRGKKKERWCEIEPALTAFRVFLRGKKKEIWGRVFIIY